MYPKYFQQELSNLRELGVEFSKKHPALAPLLSGPRADPDVERLLEGTAFLTALVQQRLDDEFPEIIHDLLQILAPNYLAPFPCATIQVFQPKATVRNSVVLPRGVSCASIPVEGRSCLFRSVYPLEIHPLVVTEASLLHVPGKTPSLRLRFELNGLTLRQWNPERLRIFLHDDEYSRAADLYLALRQSLTSIVVNDETGENSFQLDQSRLVPVGFSSTERLVQGPSNSLPAIDLLRDYFVLPNKFLFVDVLGLNEWQGRGDSNVFTLQFNFNTIPSTIKRVTKENFVLNAAPAINMFEHEADPIVLDHRLPHYPVRCSGPDGHFEVFSIDSVKGYRQGSQDEHKYDPFDAFSPEVKSNSVYHLTRKPSPVRDTIDHFVSIQYSREPSILAPETLSIRLTCTNGSLPRKLKPSDISLHAKGCPEYIMPRNLLTPTPNIPSPVGQNTLWRLLSHISLGFQTLEDLGSLKALLSLYIFPNRSDDSAHANQKRIDGITGVQIETTTSLLDGVLIRGREVTLSVREDHFSCMGDVYLFGTVLNEFFSQYASINSFVTLKMLEINRGVRFSWPLKTGQRSQI